LTHVDAEAHRIAGTTATQLATLIRAAGAAHSVLSSDCGVALLPRPVEGLREFLLLLEATGIEPSALRTMVSDNPIRLFQTPLCSPIQVRAEVCGGCGGIQPIVQSVGVYVTESERLAVASTYGEGQ
jgi:hypothetical protein